MYNNHGVTGFIHFLDIIFPYIENYLPRNLSLLNLPSFMLFTYCFKIFNERSDKKKMLYISQRRKVFPM